MREESRRFGRKAVWLKRIGLCLWGLVLLVAFEGLAKAAVQTQGTIVTATGQEVSMDDGLPEEYGFPEGYQENAVQFVTEDGVALCGYVLGKGSRGVTLGHARGWGLKSCLPIGERLVAEGYQVILWEFRDTPPSAASAPGMEERWDLDVLAAAQVLRERGVTEIIAMGASYGGTATAVAAASIPELVGVVILSSPAYDMDIDALGAMESITAPAFFAVSREDWQNAPGVYQEHVEALYEACGSEQKEIHIVEGNDHGTDMITVPPEGELGYAALPKTEEQRNAREELADELVRFVQEAFGEETAPEVQLGEFREEQMAELTQRLQKTCVETIEEFGRKVRRM